MQGQKNYSDELHQLVRTSIEPYVAKARAEIIAGIATRGFVLTAELQNSVNTAVRTLEQGLVIEVEIGMRGYGRLKDMRQLSGFTLGRRLIEAMERYVEKIGVQNFNYIPGYFTDVKYRNFKKPRKGLSHERAVNRIAWGLAVAKVRKGVVRRKGKGFFNPIKGRIEYAIAGLVARQAGKSTVDLLVQSFDSYVIELG